MRITFDVDHSALDLRSSSLVGRQVANEGIIRAYLKYCDPVEVGVANRDSGDGSLLPRMIARINKRVVVRQFTPQDRSLFTWPDAVFHPSPFLSTAADRRTAECKNVPHARLIGMTHSLSSARVLTELRRQRGKLESTDVLVCTSTCAAAVVRSSRRIELPADETPTESAEVNTTVLPLGFHAEDFTQTVDRPHVRISERRSMSIDSSDLVVLYFGRLNYLTKAHFAQTFLTLEQVARRIAKRVVLVMCGWYPSYLMARHFLHMANVFAPHVHIIHVDGRSLHVRQTIWRVADVFISMADNIQESFGLTPIEAMASGLPSIVTDWDGYRDTVRDGIDGFRISTLLPADDVMTEFARQHLLGAIDHDQFVGTLAQCTSFDIEEAVSKMTLLALNADLRVTMGNAAKQHAYANFEWEGLIAKYVNLVTAIPSQVNEQVQPSHGDWCLANLFQTFASRRLNEWDVVVARKRGAPSLPVLLNCPTRLALDARVSDGETVRRVYRRIECSEVATVRDLVSFLKDSDHISVLFAIGWLVKQGLVEAIECRK